jgi:hypothetical protein
MSRPSHPTGDLIDLRKPTRHQLVDDAHGLFRPRVGSELLIDLVQGRQQRHQRLTKVALFASRAWARLTR